MEHLNQAGITADFAAKSLRDLNMDVDRVARFVERNPANAWIVAAGSREVLEWFSLQTMPAYAFFGVKAGLPMAGCGVRLEVCPLIQRLAAWGHRRMVLLTREENVKPEPALFPRQFLDALKDEGIHAGSYNLPAWGWEPNGLHRCLESLFQVTAPTAIMVEEAPVFLAVRDHLARRGLIAPRDISLICLNPDVSFSWCDPQVTHFTYDYRSMIRRIVRWAKNAAQGKEDRRQTVTMARFIEGGTIGPAAT